MCVWVMYMKLMIKIDVDDVCDVGELGVDDVGKHGDAKNVVELEM